MTDLRFLTKGGYIAAGAICTDRGKELAAKLHSSLSGDMEDPQGFILDAFKALAPWGDFTGLAYRSETGRQLLGEFLRRAMEQALENGLIPSGLKKCLSAAVDRLEASLTEWSENPEWRFLQAPPRSAGNRVANFHASILDTPAYPLTAASLHRGIVAKIDQLADLSADRADRLLGGALHPVIHIVHAIPADAISPLHGKASPEDIDRIAWNAIRSMPRRRHFGRPGMRYAWSSLRTFMNNWRALHHALARERDFEPGRFHGSHPSYLQQIWEMDDEDLSSDEDHKLYLARLTQQMRLEEKELGLHSNRPASGQRPRDIQPLDAGRAVVAFTPSATLPGALPLVVVAFIYEWLEDIGKSLPALNASTVQTLLLTMLHTGRRPEWLLELILGKRPLSIRNYRQPVYDHSLRRFFHKPSEYLGLPSRYVPPEGRGIREWEEFQRIRQEHDQVYESINPVWEVPLPTILLGPFSRMMKVRKRALRSKKVRPDSRSESLWLLEENTRLVPMGMEHIRRILQDLTAHLRERMPDHPSITPAHFSSTFEGRYAEAGLRSEYRWYISGRLAHGGEMENRYSRVSSQAIAFSQSGAASRVCQSYAQTSRALGISAGFLRSDNVAEPEQPGPSDQYFGSWRVARKDLVIDLVKELLAGINQPQTHEPDLPKRMAAHNARVRLAVIGLGLLSGVRKQEIARLRRQDVDLEEGWVAVRGKPHCNRPAFRRLPLLPQMTALIRTINPRAVMTSHPKTGLFALYDRDGKASRLTSRGVEEILGFMGGRMGYRAMPDFHGLRHRFRSDWLAKGVDAALIDFLMGHESVGMEAYSIYSDAGIKCLAETFRAVAGELAREYGWADAAR
jgi:integrase